jgi:N-acyl-D-amino-acid deacylase
MIRAMLSAAAHRRGSARLLMPLWLMGAAVIAPPGFGAVPPRDLPVPSFDVIIEHGHVIDGTGAPWYAADIGIRAGRIAAIGRLDHAVAQQRIDATGRVVAPGFIDMLGQSELTLLVDPTVPSKVFQGITTEITGEGNSVAPVNDLIAHEQAAEFQHLKITRDWTDFAGYFARLERQHIGINVASYMGATTAREMVVGYADRAATAEELIRMQGLVAEAMRQGAVGVSSSLEYAPAPYASTAELITLAKAAAEFGGIYATHMRSEQEGILSALDETIRIGREANIPVEIWHLKAGSVKIFGMMPEIVSRIDRARSSGVDIAADTYAYPAWANDLSAFIPPWAHDGGNEKLIERLKDPAMRARLRKELATDSADWDNEWQAVAGPEAILISTVNHPKLLGIQGHTLADIAKTRGTDPLDTLFDILVEDGAQTEAAVFAMSEPDIELAVVQPWVSFCNDSAGTSPEGLLGQEFPHPRAYGTFPRVLRKYVREERRLKLEEAIRKFTSLPASRLRLNDRGAIKAGLWADIVVFDPDTITERSTFQEPNQLSVGMQWVLVNGVPVIADGVRLRGPRGQSLVRGIEDASGKLSVRNGPLRNRGRSRADQPLPLFPVPQGERIGLPRGGAGQSVRISAGVGRGKPGRFRIVPRRASDLLPQLWIAHHQPPSRSAGDHPGPHRYPRLVPQDQAPGAHLFRRSRRMVRI